jgi:hypothetical protein
MAESDKENPTVDEQAAEANSGVDAARDKSLERSLDRSLGRLSTWASVALIIGILVVPFLAARHSNIKVGRSGAPSLGHTPPEGKPSVATGTGSGGNTGTGSGQAASGAQPADKWSEGEQIAALRECLALLGPVEAEATLDEPMRQGQCGSAAPLRLRSVGSGAAKVVFDPAPEMNCKLAAGLSRWVDTVLQPAARELLSSRIVRIVGASSYACRNIYNRAVGPLSEHATGNAIDISGFVTADGRTIMVTKGWGPTERDIAAAKKKTAESARALAAKGGAKAEPAKSQTTEDTKASSDGASEGKASEARAPETKDGEGKPSAGKPRAAKDEHAEAEEGAEAPVQSADASQHEAVDDPVETGSTETAPTGATSGKGDRPPGKRPVARGSGVVPAAATMTIALTAEANFLKRLHHGACTCGVFGTVLGPEANDAHRSHFHFDMKDRKVGPICH